MPPVNPVIVSAGFIAISVAVVAAIAVYESPEIRRMADDLRRRIAIAIQSISDNMNSDGLNDEQQRQQNGEPVFNRPEDAEGFMLSRGRRSSEDPGVVADEESRRRQREELMYWNRLQMERKKEELRKAQETARAQSQTQAPNQESSGWQPREALETLQRATRDAAAAAGIYLPSLGGPQSQPRSKTSFDQFMRPDHNADRGTFVVNTGADMSNSAVTEDPLNSGLLRRRRPEGVRGLNAAAVYANPFGDEYGIELDDHNDHHTTTDGSSSGTDGPTAAEAFNSGTAYLIAPDRDESMSDIYSATEPDTNGPVASVNQNNGNSNFMDSVFDPLPVIPEMARSVRTVSEVPTSEVFFDVNDYDHESPATLAAAEIDSQLSLRLFRKPEDDNNVEENKEEADQQQHQEDINTEAYNSIQAWAQNSSGPGFYSPLPVTPSVGMSEPSVISGGELTPTGSMSVWGDDHSVIDHADAEESATQVTQPTSQDTIIEVESAPAAPSSAPAPVAGSDYGVLSEDDEDGSESVMTPTSWSEVGSVVSENDAGMQPMHA